MQCLRFGHTQMRQTQQVPHCRSARVSTALAVAASAATSPPAAVAAADAAAATAAQPRVQQHQFQIHPPLKPRQPDQQGCVDDVQACQQDMQQQASADWLQQQQQPHQHQQQEAGWSLPVSPDRSQHQSSSPRGSSSPPQPQHSLSRTLHALRSSRSSSNTAEAARAAPQLLTSAITQCETLRDALQVFWECSAAFNNIHVAALVTRLPKIINRPQQHQQHQHQQQQQQHTIGPSLTPADSDQQDLQQLLRDLSQLSEELLPCCSPREMANIAWGFAALGFHDRRLLQLLLGRCSLAALKPQELSNLCWAVARLRHEVPAAWVDEVLLLSGRVLEAGRFKPQEAANLAWSLAVMQRQCLLSAPAGGGAGLYSSCMRVGEGWKEQFSRAAHAQLGGWCAADLSQGLWALTLLGFSSVDQQWLDAALVRGLQLLGQDRMQSREAASMLWSVAKLLQQQRQQQLRVAANSRAAAEGGAVSPTVAVFAAAVCSKLPQLLQGEQQPLHTAAVVMYAHQQLQLQPLAAAVDVLLAAAARQLGSLQLASAVAHAADAAVDPDSLTATQRRQQQRQRRPQLWRRLQQQRHQQRPELLLDLSMLLYSLTQLSYRPAQPFMDAVAAVVADRAWRVVDCHDGLDALSEAWQALQQQQEEQQAAGSSSCSSAGVRAGTQQHILLQRQQLLQELQQGGFRGREASLLLWAMGKLRYQAPGPMLRPLKMALLRQQAQLNAVDVGVVFWALARMRHGPGYEWVRLMLKHFLSRIDDRVGGAADVCNVVHALPHLPGYDNLRRCLREKVGQHALQRLADAAAARFRECGPRELRQLAVGFAQLGFLPSGAWVEQHQLRVWQVGRAAFSAREWQALQEAYKQLLPAGSGVGCAAASEYAATAWSEVQQV